MNYSLINLAANFTFSVFGWYTFQIGRRTGNWKRIALGITLVVYSFFLSDPILNWSVGLILVILNYTVKWFRR